MSTRNRAGIVTAVLAALAVFGASDSDAGKKSEKALRAEIAELEARIAQLENQMRFLMQRDRDADGLVDCADSEPPPSDGCVVTGCSGQVCADAADEIVTHCAWFDAYACYRTATCERQANGRCGWTPTEELTACLTAAGPPRPRPIPIPGSR